MRDSCGILLTILLVVGAAPGSAQPRPASVTVEGRVTDSSGAGVPGAAVTLETGAEPLDAVTGPHGEFSMEGVAPGRYRARVHIDGFAPYHEVVEVGRGRRLEVQLTPAPFTETIAVTARAPFRAADASTGTRMPVALRDQPQSIQVVTRELFDERQMVRLGEAADNVSGVQRASGYGGVSSSNYFIRGFRTRSNLRNGYREEGFLGARDLANVDRIEFLKGPASVLYGGTEVGGVVNTVTKRALERPHARAAFTLGSENLVRPSVDVGGPILANGSLLYRLNGSFEHGNGFRDHHETTSYFVAPRVAWRPTARTIVEIDGELQRYDYTFDIGFLAQAEFLTVPVGNFYGEPLNRGRNRQRALRVEVTDRIAPRWTLRAGVSALGSHADPIYASLTGLAADRRTINRIVWDSDEDADDYTVRGDLLGAFDAGGLRHNLVAGLEWTRRLFRYDFRGYAIAPIDLHDPVHGAQPGLFLFGFSDDQQTDATAVYVQDLVDLGARIKLLLGLRADVVSSRFRDYATGELGRDQDDRAVTPRAGAVFTPTGSSSVYVSYARSFLPQPPTVFSPASRDGGGFEPERGRQIEVGWRQEWFDRRVSATTAVYAIRKTHVVTPDPDNPQFSIQTGEQKSRGVEIDVAGEPAPGWLLVGTWAWTDALVSRDTRLPVGARLVGVPRHEAGLFTSYRLRNGIGLGLNVVAASARPAALAQTPVQVPAHARADVHASYARDRWEVRVGVRNLHNGRHYDNHAFFVVPQPPRSVLVTLGTTLTGR